MTWALYAQELEEDLPVSSDYRIAAEAEEIITDFDARLKDMNNISVDSLVVNEVMSVSNLDLVEDIRTKEEQLGLILRQAYYQKLTTPQWASILSTDSWRESFLKWRYFVQLADYVKNSTEELFTKKRRLALRKIDQTRQIAFASPDPTSALPDKEEELTVETNNESVSKATEELIKNPVIQEEIHSVIDQEEEWEEEIEAVEFAFDIGDLTLPDSIASEYIASTSLIDEQEEVDAFDTQDAENELAEKIDPVLSEVEIPKGKESKKEEFEKSLPTPITEKPQKSNTETIVGTSARKEEKEKPHQSDITNPVVEKPALQTTARANAGMATNAASRNSLNANFADNKGRIHWPINGRITDRYGHRRNAAARGLRVENFGIDMEGASLGSVTAVFDGTVLMAIRQAPYDYIVTVKHGDYTTAYYFLDQVYVNVGDVISKGHVLGKLRSVETAPFHFEIWEGQDRLNPESWLQKK